jgi:hypothetical protein
LLDHFSLSDDDFGKLAAEPCVGGSQLIDGVDFLIRQLLFFGQRRRIGLAHEDSEVVKGWFCRSGKIE